ncbi:MAG: O-antigen ligase domain-containing protein [Planctomycetes bacterium]|nr:O-antigen ligase domain-containing protein [Planctomycetota bacterium]
MSPQALLTLAVYPLAAASLFLVLPLRRAILAAYILGWMFLPQGRYDLPGVLPDLDRSLSIGIGVLGALAFLDPRRLLSFRPGLIDVPALGVIVTPLFSSISNDLGVYDGLAALSSPLIMFGTPYLLGRIYFSDREGLRQLALAVLVAGVVYAPFCLIEARLSPQLHNWVYGSHQHSFAQVYRLGGWRPMVFLQHGLATAMWMGAATLTGAWLWSTGVLRRPVWVLMLVIVALTTLLCRSLGALFLLGLGAAALVHARASGRAAVMAAILVVAPAYVSLRATGAWTGESFLEALRAVAPPDRVQSVEFRLHNETILAERAMERPVFGWAGWGRALVKGKQGNDETVTDGWWIIKFGQNGVVGLAAFLAASALPVCLFVGRVPARWWARPEVAPAAALATLCALYTVDNLLNAMFNPMATMALGALGGLLRGRALGRRLGVTGPRIPADAGECHAPEAPRRPAVTARSGEVPSV